MVGQITGLGDSVPWGGNNGRFGHEFGHTMKGNCDVEYTLELVNQGMPEDGIE